MWNSTPAVVRAPRRYWSIVSAVLLVPLALRAQLPPSQPVPTEPMPQPVGQPVAEPVVQPVRVVSETPLVMTQPTRPGEILEQQLGLAKPLECGPAPAGWPALLERPQGTRPVEVTLTPTGAAAAVVAWRGAPWATKHELVDLDDRQSPTVPAHCYAEWGLPLQEVAETTIQVSESGRIVVEGAPLEVELAPAPVAPALQAMRDTAYGRCVATTYRYLVVAHYADSAPARSETIVSFTTAAGPPPPAFGTLVAQGLTMAVELTWARRVDALEYRVYRNGVRVADGTTVEKLRTRVDPYRGLIRADTTYTDHVPAAGTYSYRVEAVFSKCGYAPGPSGEPVSTSANVSAKALPPPIWGFADLHVHQFANLAFGGRMFWGAPFSPNGATPEERMKNAMPWCDYAPGSTVTNPVPIHGPAGSLDLLATIMAGSSLTFMTPEPLAEITSGARGFGHKVGGYPEYDGWPRWNTFTHQQVYVDWLKRAHDGGLQLMVMYAVNNEALCGPVAKMPGRTCNDMEAVDLQIDGAKNLERWIDQQSGGTGKGWYRLVYSAQEARDAIARGQLAVVLGTEVPTLFNCRASGGCTAEQVRTQLAIYRAKGIRQIVPIHNANNGFGGAAVYTDVFNISNKRIAGDYFRVRDCSGDSVRFTFDGPGFFAGVVGGALQALFSEGYQPPTYSGSGQCNELGLTPLGESFIRDLMNAKMLIDVDHMSWLALGRVLDIADSNKHNYPVLNSHTGFLQISLGKKRSEGQKDTAQLARIASRGGLVAPILFQGSRSETQWRGSKIPHACGNSSQSWAQAYLYAVSYATNPAGMKAVALGSDFNGLAGQPSPRFGPEACNGGDKVTGAELGGRVVYPFTAHGVPGRSFNRSVVGDQTFDINDDGLAHIGMLPDFIQDLKVQGLTDADLDPLFRSAEAYIRMWEQIESTAVTPLP